MIADSGGIGRSNSNGDDGREVWDTVQPETGWWIYEEKGDCMLMEEKYTEGTLRITDI